MFSSKKAGAGTLRALAMHARGTKRANELREYMLQYQAQNFRPQTSQEDRHLKKYYELFDLAAGASPSEIKQAYREICKVWHPDRFSHDLKLQQKAEQKMEEINEAYKALCQA